MIIGKIHQRELAHELLDDLPADHLDAIQSRKDLQKINRLMGSAGVIERGIRRCMHDQSPKRLIEFGAGDGSLMLRIARRIAAQYPNITITLLDRQPAIEMRTIKGFEDLGWQVDVITNDIMVWAKDQSNTKWDIGIANLFLHHFDNETLRELFTQFTKRIDSLIACEPRRNQFALSGSYLVGILGANAVTRNDAVLSVKAGFNQHELSSLWPDQSQHWKFVEKSAGLFSHRFEAYRNKDLRHV